MMLKSSSDDQAKLMVRSAVRTADDAPLAGVKVWSYDADLPLLGPGMPLGQPAVTDAQGFYQTAESSAGDLGSADLYVRAFDARGAASPILLNAPAEAMVSPSRPVR
jgi:hypothetical protein